MKLLRPDHCESAIGIFSVVVFLREQIYIARHDEMLQSCLQSMTALILGAKGEQVDVNIDGISAQSMKE